MIARTAVWNRNNAPKSQKYTSTMSDFETESNSDSESEFSDTEEEDDAEDYAFEETETGVRGRLRSASTPPQPKQRKSQATMPSTIEECDKHIDYIRKRLYGSQIEPSTALRCLQLAFQFQKDYLEQLEANRNKSPPKTTPKADIRSKVTASFNISSATYSNIMREYLIEGDVYSSTRSGNKSEKTTRISNTRAVQIAIRNYVRMMRRQRRQVSARQIFDFLVEQKYLTVIRNAAGTYERKSFESGYRAVRRLVKKLGYKRGKKKGSLAFDADQLAMRDRYLHEFVTNRALPPEKRLREVYLDESYIYQHYHPMDLSLYDENDDQDLQFKKDAAKGGRVCFIAAIQGPSPTDPERKPACLVDGSVWSFCPTDQSKHKGDYHKAFNGKNFVAWFKNQLIPNLTEPSIIIMDNAKYHKSTLDNPDVHKMTKERVKAYLQTNNVQFIDSTVIDLKAQLGEYLCNKPCDVERIAAEAGHRVLWAPPYNSDLQPIERLWAVVKGNIGRKYHMKTTLTDVKRNLDLEFHEARFMNSLIHSFIEKSAKQTKEMYDTADWDDDDPKLEEGPLAAARGASQSFTPATATNPIEQVQNRMPSEDTTGDIMQ